MSERKPQFFITGTDTGAGKTIVSAALIRYLQHGNRKVAGMKPVASGFDYRNGALRNDDVEAIKLANNVDLPSQSLNRYAFEPAIAPHIAADLLGADIDPSLIKQDMQANLDHLDAIVIEGVGGWRVPLSLEPYEDIQSLAVLLGAPVILVVGMTLGCINHALLSAESILASKVPFAGWVANHMDPDYEFSQASVETLEQMLAVPKLFELPFIESGFEAAEICNVSPQWAPFDD